MKYSKRFRKDQRQILWGLYNQMRLAGEIPKGKSLEQYAREMKQGGDKWAKNAGLTVVNRIYK